jgi:1-acyl-sn-glycerol-3-phosphate acyltransferase
MILLPAFLFSVFVMFWSLPIACLLYRIRFLSVTSKRRDDMFRWAEFLVHYFRVTIFKVGDQGLYRDKRPVIYLHNHRSWADFFLDEYVTESEASPLSRWLVFYVFPVFLTSALWMRGVVFFKRTRVADKTAFNARLEAKVTSAWSQGLIVYIEGHRNITPKSLPLKRGMLHFAHSRNYPVQIIITKGKEQLLCEKTMAVGFNAMLACGFAPPIQSSEFHSFDDFVAKVQQEWDKLWSTVYDSDITSLPLLRVGEDVPVGVQFPTYILLGQAAICSAAIGIFLGIIYAIGRLAFLSVYPMTAAALLMALTGVSMQRAVLRPTAQSPAKM